MPGPEILFVRAGFGRLGERLNELGTRRVLVLAPPSRRFVDELTHALERFSPVVFDGARVHVPAEVVEAAARKLAESGADTIVAIGGGSVVGLGKALRLAHDVKFVAVPATYAGSELTSMYGVTQARDKQTGRDDRVRPDLVLYDVSLTRDLPMSLTVQSLMNALAHVVSVVSTGSLDDAATEEALAGAATVLRAIEDLLLAPRDLGAREHALRGAAACAQAFERGKPGAQHALAHVLGGALRIEHAPLHAVLLPQFIAHLRDTNPDVVARLERAVDREDIDAYLFDLLVRAAAPVSLEGLGVEPAAVEEALAKRPELPASIARDAQYGLRPPGRGGRVDLGSEPWALLAGPAPNGIYPVVVALHGRGSEAGTIVRRIREIVGHDEHISVLGLRADAGAARWYAIRYSEAGAGSDPEVIAAIERVERALGKLVADNLGFEIYLAGFSQGACLALEVAARTKHRIAGVIAPCGARIGQPSEWAPPQTEEVQGAHTRLLAMTRFVFLGAAEGDKWIARGDIDATAAWFRNAGAHVVDISGPGDGHEITLRQRLNIRSDCFTSRWPNNPTGFGNTLTSEAIPGAVPELQNSPRVPPHGLYAEQINGTGFTAPRADNLRSWLYRIRPSSQRRAYTPLAHATLASTFDGAPEINLAGLAALPVPDDARDFVDGLVTICGAGSARDRRGYAFHLYSANRSMEHRAFYNADGDLLILPYDGTLTIMTELGPLRVEPGQVALIPRGIAFSVLLHGSHARGYVGESFGKHFRLPDRGPIGANGLADARHFKAPFAWYEDRLDPDFRIVGKLGGALHEARQDHSPFDVAGWHGNYVPFVYDLDAFSPVGNTRWDHGDPSVHTVLSSPLDEPGSHALDLVTFPARWDATTNTFRPPFFHRNTTSEINGIVREASPPGSPWQPGLVFITPAWTPHGVSGRAVERIRKLDVAEADKPVSLGGPSALWFQFESALAPVLTPWAREHALPDWAATWGSHRSYFA